MVATTAFPYDLLWRDALDISLCSHTPTRPALPHGTPLPTTIPLQGTPAVSQHLEHIPAHLISFIVTNSQVGRHARACSTARQLNVTIAFRTGKQVWRLAAMIKSRHLAKLCPGPALQTVTPRQVERLYMETFGALTT